MCVTVLVRYFITIAYNLLILSHCFVIFWTEVVVQLVKESVLNTKFGVQIQLFQANGEIAERVVSLFWFSLV